MATPRKNPSSYPPEYAELLRKVAKDRSPVSVQFKSSRRAEAFRKTLYAFRDCLHDNPEFDVELHFVAQSMIVKVTDNVCEVSVPNMAHTGDFK